MWHLHDLNSPNITNIHTELQLILFKQRPPPMSGSSCNTPNCTEESQSWSRSISLDWSIQTLHNSPAWEEELGVVQGMGELSQQDKIQMAPVQNCCSGPWGAEPVLTCAPSYSWFWLCWSWWASRWSDSCSPLLFWLPEGDVCGHVLHASASSPPWAPSPCIPWGALVRAGFAVYVGALSVQIKNILLHSEAGCTTKHLMCFYYVVIKFSPAVF